MEFSSHTPCVHLVVIGLYIAISTGCRPEPEENLMFDIHTTLAYDGTLEAGISVDLDRRAISSGVFNGNYETIAQGTSDLNGSVELRFSRTNALDYKVIGSGSEWFENDALVNPDVFLEDERHILELPMTPKAEVIIRLINANPFDENDAIQFRTLNILGDYPTCANTSGTFTGFDLVEERTCLIEGDRYLPYTYNIYRSGEWFESVLDSLWIGRGENAELTLLW